MANEIFEGLEGLTAGILEKWNKAGNVMFDTHYELVPKEKAVVATKWTPDPILCRDGRTWHRIKFEVNGKNYTFGTRDGKPAVLKVPVKVRMFECKETFTAPNKTVVEKGTIKFFALQK